MTCASTVYVIFCKPELTDEIIGQSVGGQESLRFIRNDALGILEFESPYPDCCAGKTKYTAEQIEEIIEDDTIFVGCGGEDDEDAKDSILCANDKESDFTWQEIDGVRRVVRIDFSSAALDAELGQTIVFRRDFVYDVADPFDLDKIVDSLIIT